MAIMKLYIYIMLYSAHKHCSMFPFDTHNHPRQWAGMVTAFHGWESGEVEQWVGASVTELGRDLGPASPSFDSKASDLSSAFWVWSPTTNAEMGATMFELLLGDGVTLHASRLIEPSQLSRSYHHPHFTDEKNVPWEVHLLTKASEWWAGVWPGVRLLSWLFFTKSLPCPVPWGKITLCIESTRERWH